MRRHLQTAPQRVTQPVLGCREAQVHQGTSPHLQMAALIREAAEQLQALRQMETAAFCVLQQLKLVAATSEARPAPSTTEQQSPTPAGAHCENFTPESAGSEPPEGVEVVLAQTTAGAVSGKR